MAMKRGLLLFAHGARDPRWAAPFDEVGLQVLVWVAELGGAGHPDALAAQLVAQRFQGAQLVDRPDHPLRAALRGAVDQGLPVAGQALCAEVPPRLPGSR